MFRGVFHKLLWSLLCLLGSTVGGVVCLYYETYPFAVLCAGVMVVSVGVVL